MQEEAARKFSDINADSARGFRTYVRAGAHVDVEQSNRKTTGEHPEYGALQMSKALVPARDEKIDEVGLLVEGRVGGLLSRHGF